MKSGGEAARCGQVAANPDKHVIEIALVAGAVVVAGVYLLWFMFGGTRRRLSERLRQENSRWTRLMFETPTNNIHAVQATRNVAPPPRPFAILPSLSIWFAVMVPEMRAAGLQPGSGGRGRGHTESAHAAAPAYMGEFGSFQRGHRLRSS